MALTLKQNESHSRFWGNKTLEITALVGEKVIQTSLYLTHTYPAVSLFHQAVFLTRIPAAAICSNHIQKKGPIAVLGKTLNGKGDEGT